MSGAERRVRVRVAAIVRKDDALLLVRHEKDGERYWMLPGGGVEFGETLEAALVREVREETGIDIDLGPLVLANDTIAPDGTRHVVNLCFLARHTGGVVRLGEDARIVEVAWVPLSRVRVEGLRPDIGAAVLASLAAGSADRARYLGAIWKGGGRGNK